MLDQLSETDSGLRPKLTAQSGDVEGSVRHIAQEDLEAYANGRLASPKLSYCQTHLDSCEACRAELEDLRTFKSELSGFPRSEPNRRELGRRRPRRKLTLPLVASVATIFVAATSTVLWWVHERPQANKLSTALSSAQSPVLVAQSRALVAQSRAPVAQSRVPVGQSPALVAQSPVPIAQSAALVAQTPPAAGLQARDALLADEIAALPDDVRSAVSEAIQHGKVPLTTDVSQLRGRAPTIPGAREANTGFALLGPFGEAISETRPEFSWQPLAGAIRYSVAIVDVGLHPVQRSPALRTTVWRPRRPLRRGRTYLWQVTATLRGGTKVVASRPSPSETQLRIIPLKLANEMAHFRRGHQDAHLVLGALYAQAGMLTESVDELSKIPPGDPSYNTARTLLQSLSSTGPYHAPH